MRLRLLEFRKMVRQELTRLILEQDEGEEEAPEEEPPEEKEEEEEEKEEEPPKEEKEEDDDDDDSSSDSGDSSDDSKSEESEESSGEEESDDSKPAAPVALVKKMIRSAKTNGERMIRSILPEGAYGSFKIKITLEGETIKRAEILGMNMSMSDESLEAFKQDLLGIIPKFGFSKKIAESKPVTFSMVFKFPRSESTSSMA